MLRLAIVIAAVASAQALGTMSNKAGAAELLRKKAETVTRKRELAACSGISDWSCIDSTTCRMANAGAAGSECLPPATSLGEYCEDSEHCAAPWRCFENSCQTAAAAGGACEYESEFAGLENRYPLRQCTNGYCDDSSCKTFVGIGGECESGQECDIGKAFCDIVGGVKSCTKYLANGATCSSNTECGGSNPPFSLGYCNDESSECKDFGDELGKAVGGFLLTVLVIVILGIVCCISIIYFACCRSRKTVVVVQGGAPAP